MTKMARLLDSGGTDFERALLRSALSDRGSNVARDRALRAAASVALVTAPLSAAAMPSLAVAGVLKWGATGLLLGAVFSAGSRLLQPSPDLPHATNTVRKAVPKTAKKPSPAAARARPVASAPVASAEPSTADGDARAPNAAIHPSTHPAPLPSALRAGTLDLEVAMLRESRAALVAGDARGALRALDRYHSTFASPSLGPEATTLRVEALRRLREGAAPTKNRAPP